MCLLIFGRPLLLPHFATRLFYNILMKYPSQSDPLRALSHDLLALELYIKQMYNIKAVVSLIRGKKKKNL